jgi:TPR repeat protein
MRAHVVFLSVVFCGFVFSSTPFAKEIGEPAPHIDAPLESSMPPYGNEQEYFIPENELHDLEEKALLGDGKAANRIANFYSYIKLNTRQTIYWLSIAVEDGYEKAIYNLGCFLSRSQDKNNRTRARYWLQIAVKKGEPLARSVLDELDKDGK